MRENPVEVLRWIGVLPGAVAGAFAVRYFGNHVGRFIISGWGIESIVSFAVHLLMYAATATAFVLTGAWVAPHYRRHVAIFLAIWMALLSLLTHILSQPNPGRTNFLHFGVQVTGAVLAAAFIFFGGQRLTHDDAKNS